MGTLLHVLGIDTQQSYFYDFWSGIGTQLTVVLAAIGLYRRHVCHVRRCPRLGRYPFEQYLLCRRHHPEIEEVLTEEHLDELGEPGEPGRT